MKKLPYRPQRCLAVACLGLACSLATAERVPPRPAPIAASVADEARVIVKLKVDATLLRAHALSASATSADTVARALDARAASLGARHGLAMRSGAAVGERVQVMHAAGLSSQALAERLSRDAEVEYAEPDRRVRRTLVPNDTLFASGNSQGPAVGQWYLRTPAGEVASSIDAVRAWDTTTGSAAVIVAVLDTGVRLNHPDLAGKLISGYDMVSEALISNDGNGRDADPSDPGDWLTQAEINANPTLWQDCAASDSSWHGTQVSGLIGAATGNGSGMAGSGWNVSVLPVRVLGKCFGYTSDIVAGMRWAAGIAVAGVPTNPNPAKVLNLSLGSTGACTQSERDAVAEVNARGAVVVAAAGNSAGLASGSPANCAGAIGVAALRHVGTKVGFSDVGPELSIAAPGGNCVNTSGACLYPLLTTSNSGAQGPSSSIYTDSFNISVGTSFASPLVAGTAALMFSAEPALTPTGLRSAMMASARAFPSSGVPDDPTTGPIVACRAPNGTEQLQCYCTTSTCGAGMLDAGAAVAAAVGLRAAFSVTPAAPQAGGSVTLDSSASTVSAGRSIAARAWTLVDGGGAASAFAGATDGITATVNPTAGGTMVVRLALTDDRGVTVATQQSIVVAAAPGSGGGGGGGGGGGTTSAAWLALLALAVAGLAKRRAD